MTNFVFFTFFVFEEGLLDILMMYGAYSTSRGSAITRVLWRFCWFTVASFTICYLYVYVFLPFMSFDNFISTLLYKEISRMKDCTGIDILECLETQRNSKCRIAVLRDSG